MRLLTELRGLALHAIHQKGKAVIYQNTGDGNVQQSQQPLGAGCSQQSGSATLTPELEQVANTVTQRIVPELKDQIVQAIEALQKTPSSSSTPDTEQNLSVLQKTPLSCSTPDTEQNLSGSNPNNNNINMDVNDNITPVQSFNDDLGVSVSQQMRENIINVWIYVDLETLLVSNLEQLSYLTTLVVIGSDCIGIY